MASWSLDLKQKPVVSEAEILELPWEVRKVITWLREVDPLKWNCSVQRAPPSPKCTPRKARGHVHYGGAARYVEEVMRGASTLRSPLVAFHRI